MLAEIQLLQKRVISLIRELQSARAEINRLNHLPPPEELTLLQAEHAALRESHNTLGEAQQQLLQQLSGQNTLQGEQAIQIAHLKAENEQLMAKNVALTLERDQLLQKNLYAREKVSSIIQRLQLLSQGQAADVTALPILDEQGEGV